MQRRALTSPVMIMMILILQLVPLLLLPSRYFSPASQEWWLPALLAFMVLIADVTLIVRRTTAAWPWYLMSFAQGFNIISRLMLVFSHARANATAPVDAGYILITLVSCALSAWLLWYTELPDVRVGLLRD